MTRTKAECGALGGRATVAKYGKEHMSEIGAMGAQKFYEIYQLVPAGTRDFAIVHRGTGRVVAFQSGRAVTQDVIQEVKLEPRTSGI